MTAYPQLLRRGFRPASNRSPYAVQRSCACGKPAKAGGECEECRRKRSAGLQRQTSAGAGVAAQFATAPSSSSSGEPVRELRGARERLAGSGGSSPAFAPPVVHEVLGSPGAPLDAGIRAELEPRFGHDFSGVRIHADERAAASARAVQATAYTVGRDVVFDRDAYAPDTPAGRRLLAHELTHVVQQGGGRFGGGGALRLAPSDDVFEREAEAASVLSRAGLGPLAHDGRAVGILQRAAADPGVKTPEAESDCSGWLSDPQSLSKRAAEFFVQSELPGDHGAVKKVECDPPVPSGNWTCVVHFDSGTTVKVLVTKDTIVVGAMVGHQITHPRCWYDFKCSGKNRDLILTKRKCESAPKPSGDAPPKSRIGPTP